MNTTNHDTLIVGGGLAGLIAAIDLAQHGRAVTLVEKSAHLGGRARSSVREGHTFNLGPHAVYRNAALEQVLRAFDIACPMHAPATGGYFLDGTVRHTAITGFVSLLSTGALPLSGKLELARFLAGLKSIDSAPLASIPVDKYIDDTFEVPRTREIATALARLTTYTNDPAHLSAEVFIEQLRHATLHNVGYVDGGWQTLVDGLTERARVSGVRLQTNASVERVATEGDDVHVTIDGTTHRANAVIIAATPGVVEKLSGINPLGAFEVRPVEAATLDVALSALPDPRATFGLGLDEPTYFSVHSAVADVAPAGHATIHTAVYLSPRDRREPRAIETVLERVMDRMQPGWRDVLVDKRFVPHFTVVSDMVIAERGGFNGRPDVDVLGHPGLLVAGDWVGSKGHLADASAASARRAAAYVAQRRTARSAA